MLSNRPLRQRKNPCRWPDRYPYRSVRLYVLITKRVLPRVHDLHDRTVRKHTKNVQYMVQCGFITRVSWKWGWGRTVEISDRSYVLLAVNLLPICWRWWEKCKFISRHDVWPADISKAVLKIARLPIPPKLVHPGMVQVEKGIPRTSKGVKHLSPF